MVAPAPLADAQAAAVPTARLRSKLAAALAALAVAFAALLLLWIGPTTTASFLRHGDDLLAQSNAAVRELAATQNRGSHDVLVDLIAHTAQARARSLADLPFELYAGDPAALRREITAEDRARSERLQQNADTLAAEVLARTETAIGARFAELHRQQEQLAAAFAADVRRSHLLLCATVLALLLAVLLLGLHRLVVRPVEQLRAATQRVAGGDLAVAVQGAGSDEVGALAHDFAAMVAQLRDSRGALDRLNRDLEREVAAKTAHLEQALADLQRSHKELAQAEKMASIGTLAGGVAHEFNNLIGGIRGCAAELRTDERAADRQETLDVILRAAERATGITRQLLRFARPAVERRAPVDLAALLGDALLLCEPEARRRGVAIARALPAGHVVPGDADALHQVFVNLLTNALQAMPNGGRLDASLARAGDRVTIAIADTGHGIDAADQDRIFEPFFTRRADAPDAAQRGSGLGLSVSYGIVTAHGGQIAVRSAPGQGATFTVTLPTTAPTTATS